MSNRIAFLLLLAAILLTVGGFVLDLTVWTEAKGLDHMPWIVTGLGVGFSYFLAGRFGRANEPDLGPTWRWPVFGIMAVMIFLINYHWVAWMGWTSGVWTTIWIMAVLSMPAAVLLAPRWWLAPTSYYWGTLCAAGGSLLVWGFHYGNQMLLAKKIGPMALWFVATVVLIVGLLVYLISLSVKLAKDNKLFFRLDDPAAVKLVKLGSRIADVVADTSEVPQARVPVPIRVAAQGQQAIMLWMVVDLPNRADPRPFLSWWLWVGPSFFYPGIPGFAEIARLREPVDEIYGTEFATLVTLPDRDYTKGPFSTGQGGPELTIGLGFNLRQIRPQSTFGVLRVSEMLDQVVDVLTAELATACGIDLYGFHGDPVEQRPGLASLELGRAARPQRRLHFGEPAVAPVPLVALLIRAFIDGVFLMIGYQVTGLRIKDINVGGATLEINEEMVQTWARRQLAEAQSETVRLIAGQQVQALVAEAQLAGVSSEDIGKILVQAATLYFMQGGDAGSALMAVLARRS